MIKVIEDNLCQLLKQISFHDTLSTMLQLDAPFCLSEQVLPVLNSLSMLSAQYITDE